MQYILIINVGSTSVKLALFDSAQNIAGCEAPFSHSNLAGVKDAVVAAARQFLNHAGCPLTNLAAIAARGGLLRPLAGGTYRINARMLEDLASARFGRHGSNLSAISADVLAREANIPAFIVDPVTVDELAPEARLTGIPAIHRRSIFHALSQKAAARRAAMELGKRYENASFIVAHLGGGISVGAHRQGRVVDVNNALDGDGPITPERAGTIPAGSLVELCFSGQFDLQTVKRMLTGAGGIFAYAGTSDMRQLDQRIRDGDEKAGQWVNAMAFTIARQIAGMTAALHGRVDAVVLAGAMVSWTRLVDLVRPRIAFIAPILVYPENMEMQALALGALRVIEGKELAQEY